MEDKEETQYLLPEPIPGDPILLKCQKKILNPGIISPQKGKLVFLVSKTLVGNEFRMNHPNEYNYSENPLKKTLKNLKIKGSLAVKNQKIINKNQ